MPYLPQLAYDVYDTLAQFRGPRQDVYLAGIAQTLYVRETPAWYVVPVQDPDLRETEAQVWAMADGESPVGLWVVIEAAAGILNSHGFVTAVMGPALTVARQEAS